MLRFDLNDAKDREWLLKHGVNLDSLDNLSRPDKNATTGKENPKYRNKKVEWDGLRFDSKFELQCWLFLKQLEKQNQIKNLKRQVTVTFIHNNVKLMSSRPDFYFEVEAGDHIIPIYADAKNPVTAKLRPFRIAQRMFTAFYGAPMLVFTKLDDIIPQIKHHSG